MSRSLPFLGFLVLAFFPVLARAQPSPYLFSLKAEKLDVPASPWQVTRLLDLRADRSRLGTVHRGLDNMRTSVNFAQPLAPEVLQFVRAKAPVQAGARPVVLRVFALGLAEEVRPTSEHAEAELIADFLEPLPDSTFRVLLRVGETTRRGGLDVTKFHPANVALLLQQALRRLAALPAPDPTGEILSRADALAGRGGTMSQRFPIQKAAELQRGFYRSFEEFRNNAPSEPEYPFAITHVAHAGKRWAGSDEVQVNYLQTDAEHPNRPVSTSGLWGLCDGNELLVIYRNRFYKLLAAPDGLSYTFTGPPLYDAEGAASNAIAAGLLGGAAGAIIASSANQSPTMVPYELHLASGRVMPVAEIGQTDTNGFSTQPDTAGVFIYRRADAQKGQAVTLNASGQPATTLQGREWTAISWRDRRRELKLCVQLGTGQASCREFVPDFSQPTYLECVVPAGGGQVELRPVSAKEGLFELRRIQRTAKEAK